LLKHASEMNTDPFKSMLPNWYSGGGGGGLQWLSFCWCRHSNKSTPQSYITCRAVEAGTVRYGADCRGIQCLVCSSIPCTVTVVERRAALLLGWTATKHNSSRWKPKKTMPEPDRLVGAVRASLKRPMPGALVSWPPDREQERLRLDTCLPWP
jgi:hypothetical protein